MALFQSKIIPPTAVGRLYEEDRGDVDLGIIRYIPLRAAYRYIPTTGIKCFFFIGRQLLSAATLGTDSSKRGNSVGVSTRGIAEYLMLIPRRLSMGRLLIWEKHCIITIIFSGVIQAPRVYNARTIFAALALGIRIFRR